MTARLILTFCLYVVFVTGCADPRPGGHGEPVAPPDNVTETPMAKPGIPAGSIQLASSILAPAIADLAERTGAQPEDIVVRRALPVIWNNGSVGCPEPGMAYTQALVPGYWAVLEHDGRYYSYHAAGQRPFRLCERANVRPDGAPPHGRYNDAV